MHYLSPFYSSAAQSPFAFGFMSAVLPFLIIVAIWTTVLKGFALWHAARNSQKEWFIALLILNTLGIVEIIYLVWFRPSSPHARRRSHSSHAPAHDSSAKA